ncbi:hypothetical protein [Paenibacillus sp. DMB5]|uniref:hypothetical protein n=1 Tax=Paenibacillus sp. DMB5 TaxID=1780103 RepID=UPI00076BD398|nr:hypothetical protein [Paenibacillus sp. DMB5]KUP25506.1 hypothetical protein AWJ19_18990 [Paenibacillus sp. DMB5]
MKKWMILMSVFVIILSVILIKNKEDTSIYESDYFSKLGLSYHKHEYQYKYTTMIKDFGEPLKIEEKDGKTYCFYKEFFFMYYEKLNKNSINYSSAFNVTVTSDKYKFGKDKIGVGSEIEEVEKAYIKSIDKEAKHDYTGFRDGSSYDEQWVEYYFDKNDRVRAITLGLSV